MNRKLQLDGPCSNLVPVKHNKAHGKGAFIQCPWWNIWNVLNRQGAIAVDIHKQIPH